MSYFCYGIDMCLLLCIMLFKIMILKKNYLPKQLFTYFTTLLLQHYMSTTDTLYIIDSLSGFIVQRVQSLEEECLHWQCLDFHTLSVQCPQWWSH